MELFLALCNHSLERLKRWRSRLAYFILPTTAWKETFNNDCKILACFFSLSISRETHEKWDRTSWQFVIVENKLTPVFHVSVLLLTMNFIITLSKQPVDQCQLLPYRSSATNTYNIMMKFIINNRIDTWKTDTNSNLLIWFCFLSKWKKVDKHPSVTTISVYSNWA